MRLAFGPALATLHYMHDWYRPERLAIWSWHITSSPIGGCCVSKVVGSLRVFGVHWASSWGYYSVMPSTQPCMACVVTWHCPAPMREHAA